MYRPTVRYDDIFREYVNEVFYATHLDRNQIIRLALFSAAYSKEFCSILEQYKKRDVSLPFPKWGLQDGLYWKEQRPKIKGRGKDVNVESGGESKDSEDDCGTVREQPGARSDKSRCIEPVTRRERTVPAERIAIKNQGGISFTFN